MSGQEEGLIGLVEVPKKQAQIILESGYLYLEMGNYKEAEEVFAGCASLLPRSDVPQLGLGQLYLSQEQYDKAAKAYQKAIELNPTSPNAYVFLGEVYLFQKKTDQAVQMLEKAQEIEKDEPSSATDMARSLLEAQRLGTFV